MHIHSHFSDGSDSPTQIVQKAKSLGLKAICLTDHDNYEGLPEFVQACREHNMNFLCGIEIMTFFQGIKIEILAYGIDLPRDEKLKDILSKNWKAHNLKVQKMLNGYSEHGIFTATVNDIKRAMDYKGPFATKAWLREFRVQEFDVEKKQAKQETAKNGVAYAPYDQDKFITPEEVFDFVHALGWRAVLAHGGVISKEIPEFQKWTDFIKLLVLQLKPLGLFGVEAYHYRNEKQYTEFLVQMAREHGLAITGGSDYHGRFQSRQIGQFAISYENFLQFKELINITA